MRWFSKEHNLHPYLRGALFFILARRSFEVNADGVLVATSLAPSPTPNKLAVAVFLLDNDNNE